MENLEYPEWYQGNGRHFLEGIPMFGTQVKLKKHVAKTTSSRDIQQVKEAWGPFANECKTIMTTVFNVVNKYVEWPNNYFFPGDKFALVTGMFPGAAYDVEDVIFELKNEFDVTDEYEERYYQIVENGTLGELVELILDQSSSK